MRVLAITAIATADQARDLAIEWQDWSSKHALTWGQLSLWQGYWGTVARKFPELTDEFKENGIL